MYGNYGNQRSFAPVKVGEELDVRIEAVGEKGDGIAKKRGFVLFVPGTNEGDEVRVRVTKVLKKVGFAESIGKALGTPEEDSQPQKKREQTTQENSKSEEDLIPEGESSDNFGEEQSDDSSDADQDEDYDTNKEEY